MLITVMRSSRSGISEEEKWVENVTREEDEANELYRDVKVNLEGRDTVMTDAPLPNSSSVLSGFISNMLNPRPDTGIDSIFNLYTEATSLVDVSVTTIAEPPLMFATTLPPPPTPLTHMQQTPVPTPTIVVKTAIQLQSDRLRDEAQAKNEDFLNKLDENIKKIIKDQVKEQVKAQVSKILPRIEKTLNEQLEVEVMTRSTTESKEHLFAYRWPTSSELELKKILIEKMESNKRRDDEDKDEEPSVDQTGGGFQEETSGKEPESTILVELEYFFEEVYKATTDQLDWHNPEGQKYPHDLRKPLPLIPNSRGRQVIPFDHFINNGPCVSICGVSSRIMTYFRHKWTKAEIMVKSNGLKIWSPTQSGVKKSPRDVYSKRRIIAVTKLQIVEMEGDFKRLRLQDIEDMLILLIQGKLTNLNVDDCLAFGVSMRMFTRSIIIQRRIEDLQLGVESYQKKLNIIKPNTYRSDLKRRDAYTSYSIQRLHSIRTKIQEGTKLSVMMELNKSDKERAKAMIQVIDKQLKSRWIMRSLEKFVGGRPYEGDLHAFSIGPFSLRSFSLIVKKGGSPPLASVDPYGFEGYLKMEVKKLPSLCDIRSCSRSDGSVKLKNFKKDATLKLFKSTNQERCSRSHSRQAKEQAQDLKSTITTLNHKLIIEVKDYELKT
ncbi:hypothetical protein Tco_0422208 [Tanacetum coccineum]